MPESTRRWVRGRPPGPVAPDAFSRRLRVLREAAGLTMAQLSRAAGLCPTLVIRLERRHGNPTWDTVLRLCDVLRCTPNDFM